MANISKNGKVCNYPKELLNSRLYKIWQNMKSRCSNPKVTAYAEYGGRGISYCKEWETFAGFLDTMPAGYSSELTIDRVNNQKGYSPSNCRWATPQEQSNNTRRNRIVEYKGKTYTLATLVRELGLKSSTVRQRYYVYKWPIERCLLT